MDTVETFRIQVATLDGKTTEHLYPVPTDREQRAELVRQLGRLIFESVSGRDPVTIFEHPYAFYRSAHIVSISDGNAGANPELSKDLHDEGMGFLRERNQD